MIANTIFNISFLMESFRNPNYKLYNCIEILSLEANPAFLRYIDCMREQCPSCISHTFSITHVESCFITL